MQGGGFQTKPGGRLRQALNPTHAAGPSQERTGRGTGSHVLTARCSGEDREDGPGCQERGAHGARLG